MMPTTMKPSHQELLRKKLDSHTFEKAVHSLHADGLVVNEGVMPYDQQNPAF